MEILFYLFATISIAASLGVIVSSNPIHSALSLIVAMLTMAAFFAMLDAHFLAVVQVIVYAGAIVVLVLFVLMLLNTKREFFSVGIIPLVVFSVASVGVFLLVVLPLLGGFALNPEHVKDVQEKDFGSVVAVGRLLYTKYAYTFELASMLIMAALVGAVMLGRSYRQAGKEMVCASKCNG